MSDCCDDTDKSEEVIEAARRRNAAAKVAMMAKGKPGECKRCGEYFVRLIGGACGRCRDKFKLP